MTRSVSRPRPATQRTADATTATTPDRRRRAPTTSIGIGQRSAMNSGPLPKTSPSGKAPLVLMMRLSGTKLPSTNHDQMCHGSVTRAPTPTASSAVRGSRGAAARKSTATQDDRGQREVRAGEHREAGDDPGRDGAARRGVPRDHRRARPRPGTTPCPTTEAKIGEVTMSPTTRTASDGAPQAQCPGELAGPHRHRRRGEHEHQAGGHDRATRDEDAAGEQPDVQGRGGGVRVPEGGEAPVPVLDDVPGVVERDVGVVGHALVGHEEQQPAEQPAGRGDERRPRPLPPAVHPRRVAVDEGRDVTDRTGARLVEAGRHVTISSGSGTPAVDAHITTGATGAGTWASSGSSGRARAARPRCAPGRHRRPPPAPRPPRRCPRRPRGRRPTAGAAGRPRPAGRARRRPSARAAARIIASVTRVACAAVTASPIAGKM